MTDLEMAVAVAAAAAVGWIVVVNLRDRLRLRREEAAAPKRDQEPTIFSAPVERVLDSVMTNPFSDAIATLRFSKPLSGDQVQQALRGWRHVGSKPLSFAWASDDGQFQAQLLGGPVTALQIGVLLATRAGPLHAMEYSEWQAALDRLARELGASLDLPSMTDVLSRARSLDHQCAAVDAQLTVSVSTPDVLSASAIQSAAELLGLEPRGESRYAMGALHHQQFVVFPGDGGGRLTFLLDLPRTTSPLVAFQLMVETAERMAERLSGVLTDEAGRPLSEQSLARIAQQVEERVTQFEQMGLTPGSQVAQRLFLS